jgi:tight adherence protein B
MRLIMLVMAAGCVLAAAALLYLSWLARARRDELQRLKSLFQINLYLETGPGKSDAPIPPPLPQGLVRRLRQTGWHPQPRDVAALLLGCLAAMGLAMAYAGLAGVVLAAPGLLLLLLAAVEICARRRMRALRDAMPGFLERVRQAIAVGNSLATALERAVAASPPIVAGAMAITIRRIHNGGGVAESLERCAAENDVHELHLLATATRANLRFGGSMTQILRNMIENIRRRTSVERELRAGTAQIRASAWIVGLLPILVAAMVMLSNRGYARWFLETEAGHKMVLYALVSQLAGAWLMRLITRARY